MDPGGQRAAELGDARSKTAPPADRGLVVPDQAARHSAELFDQQPHAQQQVGGLTGRHHHSGHEPRVSSHDHQHRQQCGGAILERDPFGREPQVALRRITRRPRQPVSRVLGAMLGPQPDDVLAEPRRRTRPADPLGEHRRRHVRELRQQRCHPHLEGRERRRLNRRPAVFGRRPTMERATSMARNGRLITS